MAEVGLREVRWGCGLGRGCNVGLSAQNVCDVTPGALITVDTISIVNDILFKQCFRHFKSTIDLEVGAQKTKILLGA